MSDYFTLHRIDQDNIPVPVNSLHIPAGAGAGAGCRLQVQVQVTILYLEVGFTFRLVEEVAEQGGGDGGDLEMRSGDYFT